MLTDISEYFTDDIDMLRQRSIIFVDILRVSGLFEVLEKITKQLSDISEILRCESDIGDKERSIFSVKQPQPYFEVIDETESFYETLYGSGRTGAGTGSARFADTGTKH